jgi:hypothetical protein
MEVELSFFLSPGRSVLMRIITCSLGSMLLQLRSYFDSSSRTGNGRWMPRSQSERRPNVEWS